MHACDIRQYLTRQNVLCTILPYNTLANILSYTVCVVTSCNLSDTKRIHNIRQSIKRGNVLVLEDNAH